MSRSGSDAESEADASEFGDNLFELSPEEENTPIDYDIQFGTITRELLDSVNACCCRTPIDVSSALSLCFYMCEQVPTKENITCLIDNLQRCINLVLTSCDFEDPERLALVDVYFRLRHEILFKLLLQTLNLPVRKSDSSFSTFGIPSGRTPDYITLYEDIIIIIEVGVTSNYERMAQTKGSEIMGYQSKYETELNWLKDNNIQYRYYPIIFDVTTVGGSYKTDLDSLQVYFRINSTYSVVLDTALNMLSRVNYRINDVCVALSPLLFKTFLPIPDEHDQWSDFYTNDDTCPPFTYKEFTLSNPVYITMYNKYHLIPRILESTYDKGTYLMCLSIKTNRLSMVKAAKGFTTEEFQQRYDDNDRKFFYYHLLIETIRGNVYARDADSGVTFTYRARNDKYFKTSNFEPFDLSTSHQSLPYKGGYDTKTYVDKLDKHYRERFNSVHFDPTYEDLLVEKIAEFDGQKCTGNNFHQSNPNMLCSMKMTDLLAVQTIDRCIKKFISVNDFENPSIPLKVRRLKQPFLYPLADLSSNSYAKLETKNTNLCEAVMIEIQSTNPYTTAILQKFIEPNYELYTKPQLASDKLLSLYQRRAVVGGEITRLYKVAVKSLSVDEIHALGRRYETKLSEQDQDSLTNYRSEMSTLSKDILSKEKQEGVRRSIGFARIPIKKRGSFYRHLFKKEMQHFKSPNVQSTYSGIGLTQDAKKDHIQNYNVFKDLTLSLLDYRGVNNDHILHDYVSEDSQLLRELKQSALDKYRPLIENVVNSALGHATALISRIGHTLLFLSQLAFNSDYVRIDNLGYTDVLIMVRGGKKVFKSKASKMFRLLLPISEQVLPWYSAPYGYETSMTILQMGGKKYLLTPWQMWNETLLTDSLSFHTRVCSFVVLNMDPTADFALNFNRLSINVLLAFHNRRKTEVMLANLRYILVATMGEYSGIGEIFDEFVSFNSDHFNSFCKTCVLMNYPQYYSELLQINKTSRRMDRSVFERNHILNIFTRGKIDRPEDLALMVYSTFLMSKAPYQKVNERANNLIGILKIHDEYIRTIGEKLAINRQNEICSQTLEYDQSLEDYVEELFKNDFYYDPKFVACVGVFTDSYFRNKGLKDKIHAEWLKVMSMSSDNISSSSGLRGEIGSEDFWGKKGYFVVYKPLAKNEAYIEKLTELLDSEGTDHDKTKLLNKLNKTFMDELFESGHRDYLLFHAVDKVQWRGGREIYVMDVYTKTLQQPIEKFAGFLCEHIENEFISIPSDKRAQVIHHQLFEKDLPLKEMMNYYLTLDCRKWAPKSIITKLVVFVLNIDILPPSFKKYFMNYCQKLYHKRIYFQKSEVNQLKKNPMYTEVVEKYCVHDPTNDAFYIEMNYSWMMGIFNYMSSFLHAMNQLFAGYLIKETALRNLNQEISMTMNAHSDDSSGRIVCSEKWVLERCLYHYEWMLKGCNHLLSRKKSLVSRLYYEMLSIIYIGKELLSLMPKFSGGIKFSPTDKGMAQDLLQSYSKSNEVLIAGGTFTQCYLVLKFHSYLVFKFYVNRRPVEDDYLRPPQFLGMPDSHPLMAILVGSDCDLLRMVTTEAGKDRLIKLTAITNKLMQTVDEPGCVRPLKFKITVRGLSKDFEDVLLKFSEVIKDWSVNNVNFRNTAFNFLNFLGKLKDPGFVGSLTNESTTRRLSRCFWMRNNDCVILNHGLAKIKNVITMYEFICKELDPDYKELLKGIINIDDEFSNEHAIFLSSAERDIECMVDLISGPIKLYKYFNQLSLKDKPMKPMTRTIKPTHLQLIKTGKPFSVSFDAAQLVSYAKKLKFNWAFSNVGRLHTAYLELVELLKAMGIEMDSINVNMLHKLCKNYVEKSVKDVYLYSQIPSDIRVIKTYSSFLNFLAYNSHSDVEIHGITLDLGSKMTDPSYVKMQIDDDTYTVMTILSLLLTIGKTDRNFLRQMSLNGIETLQFCEGSVLSFIEHIEKWKFTNPDFIFIKLPLSYLKEMVLSFEDEMSSDVLRESCYYVFLKEQRSSSDWRGAGQLLIVLYNVYYIFEIHNDKLVSVVSNSEGKVQKFYANFMVDVMLQNGIRIDRTGFLKLSDCRTEKIFGFDYSGDLCLSTKNEMVIGIEAKVQDMNVEIMHAMYKFKVKYIKNNLFLATGEGLRSYKIYSIKPKVTEFAMVAKEIFNPSDFKTKLIEEGLDTFEEFLYTELLVSMGARTFISFKEIVDNVTASRLFQIITTVIEIDGTNNCMPDKVITGSKLPAGRGSLLRFLFRYGEIFDEQIIAAPTKISSDILSIRNEYPESFTIILRDKMQEAYEELYSISEKKEIANCYLTLTQISDPQRLKTTILNYMSVWGFDSFNNFLGTYSFVKDKESYKMYTFETVTKKGYNYFANQFEQLFKAIMAMFNKYEFTFKFYDQEVEMLGTDMYLLERLPLDIVYSLYDFKYPFLNCPVSYYIFLNILHVALKNLDFCADLEHSLKDIPVLNAIPIDYNYRQQLIATINYLLYNWLATNLQHEGFNAEGETKHDSLNMFELQPWRKLQRLPISMQVPKVLASRLSEIRGSLYHHGLMSAECFALFETTNMGDKVETKTHIYKVRGKISELSVRCVPENDYIKFERPIIPRYISKMEDLFEELKYEENEEGVEYEQDNLGGIKYTESPTKVEKKNKNKKEEKTIITTQINWVFKLGGFGADNVVPRINQIGENVVLISPCFYNSFLKLYNSHIRVCQLDSILSHKPIGTPLVCHIRCHKKLKMDFWDAYLPGKVVEPKLFSSLGFNHVIDVDYKVRPYYEKIDLAMYKSKKKKLDEEEEMQKKKEIEELRLKTEQAKQDERSKYSADQLEFLELSEKLEEEFKAGKISMGINNYIQKIINEHLTTATETEKPALFGFLNKFLKAKMLSAVNNDKLTEGLSREQYIKVFQAPSHFGLAHGYDLPTDKNVKDEKVRAEINSIDSNLIKYIASGTLTVSKSMLQLIKSNLMIWDMYVKNPKLTNQNGKNFLLLLLRLLVTDAVVVSSHEHDDLWQNVINSFTIQMTEGYEEEDSSDEDIYEYKFGGMTSRSRLKYRASGF